MGKALTQEEIDIQALELQGWLTRIAAGLSVHRNHLVGSRSHVAHMEWVASQVKTAHDLADLLYEASAEFNRQQEALVQS